MNINKIKIGTYIQILDGSEWHGLIGIVDKIINGIPIIFCVQRPTNFYWVYPELMDKIKIIKD